MPLRDAHVSNSKAISALSIAVTHSDSHGGDKQHSFFPVDMDDNVSLCRPL